MHRAGGSGRRFPYGDPPRARVCNTSQGAKPGALAPSGHDAACESGYGVVDLSGNAAEWVQTRFGTGLKTLKGGSYLSPDVASRCASRRGAPSSTRGVDVGFRCCMAPGR